MKAKEIQELIDFIAKSGLNKVNIETEEFKISVQREPNQKVTYMTESAPRAIPQGAPVAALQAAEIAPTTTPALGTVPASPSDESRYIVVKAPMIGTFYRSASPESPSFANVGDDLVKGQVICIIEAMKLFNEIESEVSGKIVKVLADNASPVEYDQPLFLVDPS